MVLLVYPSETNLRISWNEWRAVVASGLGALSSDRVNASQCLRAYFMGRWHVGGGVNKGVTDRRDSLFQRHLYQIVQPWEEGYEPNTKGLSVLSLTAQI